MKVELKLEFFQQKISQTSEEKLKEQNMREGERLTFAALAGGNILATLGSSSMAWVPLTSSCLRVSLLRRLHRHGSPCR